MQARSSLFFFWVLRARSIQSFFFFFWGHQHGRREVMRKPRIQDAKIAWVGFDERGNQTVRRKPSKSSWDPLYSGCCLVRIRVQYSISFPEPVTLIQLTKRIAASGKAIAAFFHGLCSAHDLEALVNSTFEIWNWFECALVTPAVPSLRKNYWSSGLWQTQWSLSVCILIFDDDFPWALVSLSLSHTSQASLNYLNSLLNRNDICTASFGERWESELIQIGRAHVWTPVTL